MILALRTRGIVLCMVSAVLCGAAAGVFGQQFIAIPFLGSLFMPTQMPAPVIPALVLSIILGASIHGSHCHWMLSSVRNIWAHSMGFAGAMLVIASVVCALAVALAGGGQFPTLVFVRDLATLMAFWLVGILFGMGATATVVPVAYVAFCSAFARSKSGEYFPWAWIMQPHPYSWLGLISIGAGIGIALLLIKRRRPLR